MRKTLRDIAKRFNTENEIWLLAGNTAAVLQGAMIQSRKLTFYTSKLGSYRFGEIFNDYRCERVKYREKPPLAGHIGLFEINDIEIRVVGDPEVFFEHRKFPIPIDDIYLEAEMTDVEGQEVPLLPLSWLMILGLMGGDDTLVQSVASCEIDGNLVREKAANMGVSYYLKPQLDQYL
jgi:hypothetical protein